MKVFISADRPGLDQADLMIRRLDLMTALGNVETADFGPVLGSYKGSTEVSFQVECETTALPFLVRLGRSFDQEALLLVHSHGEHAGSVSLLSLAGDSALGTMDRIGRWVEVSQAEANLQDGWTRVWDPMESRYRFFTVDSSK